MSCETYNGSSNFPISIFIERQLPDWAVTDHPKFQLFLEAYYEWLESQGQAYKEKYCLRNNLDVDHAIDEFLSYFKREYLLNLPKELFNINRCVDTTFTAANGIYQYLVPLERTNISQITVYIDNIEVDKQYYSFIENQSSCTNNFSILFDDGNVSFTGGESIRVEICDIAAVNERLLIKIIKEFNIARGTEASYKFLFRLLFNEDIEIFYPNKNILIPSDGKWDGSSSIVQKSSGFSVTNPAIRRYKTGINVPINSLLSVSLNAVPLLSSEYYLEESYDGNKVTVDIVIDSSVTLNISDLIQFHYQEYAVSGTFLNEDGKLSSIMILQDGLKNQQFSYVIKSSHTVDQYANIVKNMLHPAGLAMFGEISLINCIHWFVQVGYINGVRGYDVALLPIQISSSNDYVVTGTPQLGATWGTFDIWKIDLGLQSQGESNTVIGDFGSQVIEEIENNPNKAINFLLDSRIDVYPTPP